MSILKLILDKLIFPVSLLKLFFERFSLFGMLLVEQTVIESFEFITIFEDSLSTVKEVAPEKNNFSEGVRHRQSSITMVI